MVLMEIESLNVPVFIESVIIAFVEGVALGIVRHEKRFLYLLREYILAALQKTRILTQLKLLSTVNSPTGINDLCYPDASILNRIIIILYIYI